MINDVSVFFTITFVIHILLLRLYYNDCYYLCQDN